MYSANKELQTNKLLQVDAFIFRSVPSAMPTPTMETVSPNELRVIWKAPTNQEARGKVITYTVYYLKNMDLQLAPDSPPYMWQVRYN